MPDYAIRLEESAVLFVNRRAAQGLSPDPDSGPYLSSSTYNAARAAAPGWDVYHLEQTWRNWMADGGLDAPRDPEKAFVGFCTKWFEKRGKP